VTQVTQDDDALAFFSESAGEKRYYWLGLRGTGMKTKTENLLPKTIPGAICVQLVRCGKSNCKCARGELHGPYFYHFVRVNGALVKRYVKAKDAPTMRAACAAWRENDKQLREMRNNSHRRLSELIKKLRESEKLLLQTIEVSHGKTN
jgi:hypothetical protein